MLKHVFDYAEIRLRQFIRNDIETAKADAVRVEVHVQRFNHVWNDIDSGVVNAAPVERASKRPVAAPNIDHGANLSLLEDVNQQRGIRAQHFGIGTRSALEGSTPDMLAIDFRELLLCAFHGRLIPGRRHKIPGMLFRGKSTASSSFMSRNRARQPPMAGGHFEPCQSDSRFTSAFVAPLWNARRRCSRTTGIVARRLLTLSTRSVPARSSSATLLSGSSASPKPASTIRF